MTRRPATGSPATTAPATAREVLAWLQGQGSETVRRGMARYAIPADNAFGVSVGDLRRYAKELGRNHGLAAELWKCGRYEARMLAAFIDQPEQVTSAQMDRWCLDFDNWAICDTVCFHLFDRTPHAWEKVERWAKLEPEFSKRASFALLWSLAAHDKKAADRAFLDCFPLLEEGAKDDRNFVKKSVDMALRAVGKRNRALNTAARELASRLSDAPEPSVRWVGKKAGKELSSPSVSRRLG